MHGPAIDAALGQSTPELPKEYECHFSRCIASIVPIAPDKFTLAPTTNLLLVQTQIQTILEAPLTFFSKITDTKTLVEVLVQKGMLKQKDVFRYCLQQEWLDLAKHLVKLFHQNMDQERWATVFKP